MNIPVQIKSGEDHPSLSTIVFKGADFRLQEQLYNELQSVVTDPAYHFMTRIDEIRSKFENYETVIIERTKSCITSDDQICGKLIPRTPEDAAFINDTSAEYFSLLNDVCREANLASNVPMIKPPLKITKRREVICEKIMPGVTSIAIGKQIDDTLKRARSILQRIGILISDITTQQRVSQDHFHRKKATTKMIKSIQRFLRQQVPFLESVITTNHICKQVQDDRRNHIQSIETARNKKNIR
jgi:hypothetical protein